MRSGETTRGAVLIDTLHSRGAVQSLHVGGTALRWTRGRTLVGGRLQPLCTEHGHHTSEGVTFLPV